MRSRSELAALLALALLVAAPSARAQESGATAADSLDPLRERFRTGLERFRAGAFAEAILIWETIYRELGPEKGYRLAFNLARAYEQFGDPTRAAESYDAYVAHVARRREAGEALEPVVEKQEAEALERLRELGTTQGRIRIAGDRAVLVRIDGGAERLVPTAGWVAYVTPGKAHVVTFDPGTPSEKHVEVRVELGEIAQVSPPALGAPERPPEPVALPVAPRTDAQPYPPTVIYVAAGLTAVSTILPIALYARAGSIRSDYDGVVTQAEASRRQNDPIAYATAQTKGQALRGDYDDARSAARVSLALPIAFGAVTAGLAAYWFFGSKTPRTAAFALPTDGGMFVGSAARF